MVAAAGLVWRNHPPRLSTRPLRCWPSTDPHTAMPGNSQATWHPSLRRDRALRPASASNPRRLDRIQDYLVQRRAWCTAWSLAALIRGQFTHEKPRLAAVLTVRWAPWFTVVDRWSAAHEGPAPLSASPSLGSCSAGARRQPLGTKPTLDEPSSFAQQLGGWCHPTGRRQTVMTMPVKPVRCNSRASLDHLVIGPDGCSSSIPGVPRSAAARR